MTRTSVRPRVGTVAAALVAVALLLTGCSGGGGNKAAAATGCAANGLTDHTDQQFCGVGLGTPYPRPQFTLTDTSGKSFKFGTVMAGKPTLLFFGYTNCPDVCPTTMADIANALLQVKPEIRSVVQVVFVSTDPKNDTPAAISAWLSKFDSGLPNKFIGLRGTDAQVDAAEVTSHVMKHEDSGKTHAANVLFYGADDYAKVMFLQSTDESADIAHDLGVIVGSK